jgi:polyisoprenoid-binding protein YceI
MAASAAGTAQAEPRAYLVDAAESRFVIQVGRAGLFKFAGHTHQVVATGMQGRVLADPDDLAGSSVTLEFPSEGLRVTGAGEPQQDVPKVQAKMQGPEVLHVARFARVSFRSTGVEGRPGPAGVYNLRLTGELELRGVRRALTLPLRVELAQGGVLVATGQAVLKQTDFQIKPVSVAGVVKVKNELGIDYKIVARLAP